MTTSERIAFHSGVIVFEYFVGGLFLMLAVESFGYSMGYWDSCLSFLSGTLALAMTVKYIDFCRIKGL